MIDYNEAFKKFGRTLIIASDGYFDAVVSFQFVLLDQGMISDNHESLIIEDKRKAKDLLNEGVILEGRVEEWLHAAESEQKNDKIDNRVHHRVYGPAITFTDEATNTVIREEYFNNGYRHRPPEQGPALRNISHITGIAYLEQFYHSDKLHNPYGPAIIERDPISGDITRKKYYLMGERVLPFENDTEIKPTPQPS